MITLESIKQKQDEVAKMIAAFESYTTEKVSYPAVNIDLLPGEKYAGLILGKDGDSDYHLILLPEQIKDVKWDEAVKWAKKQGGEFDSQLPNRREQSLLFANLKEEFEEYAYWSSEQHASYSDYAWSQHFYVGHQYYWTKTNPLRARAVRRLAI